jgi:Zn-dependent protease with chaperone function
MADREAAAARLGTQRRRVFVIATIASLLAPLLPYITGVWESLWFGLAATPLPLVARVAVFLIVFHLVIAIVVIPIGYYSGYVLPRAFGLSRQSVRDWSLDWMKGTLLTTFLGVLVAGAFLWSVDRFGSSWWWVVALFLTAIGLVLVFATPYVLVPLFFKMRPLADQATADRIRALVRRAGAEISEVCSLDFSRRTAEANAAVIGMGRSRRVVLADTLLAEFPPNEVDAVIAHEIGHHVHHDVQRLLLGNGLLIWIGLAIAGAASPAALPLLSLPSLSYVPGYPVVFAVAELFFVLIAPITNWWSRRLESAADRFALELTSDPAAFAGAMRRLAHQNLVEIHPPRWAEVLLASHPALHRRIALAQSWSA